MIVHVCDCCHKETDELYECYRELRTWRGYRLDPKRWELCEDCIENLENVLESEIQRIKGIQSK